MTAITVNLDNNLLEFVKTFAKENKITQREVFEMSLKEVRKNEMRKSVILESIEIAENKELSADIYMASG
jgi:hypothetical protein